MAANAIELIVNRQEADAIRAGLQMLKTRDMQDGFPMDTSIDVVTLIKSFCELSNEEIDELCDLLDFEKSSYNPEGDSVSPGEEMLTQIT